MEDSKFLDVLQIIRREAFKRSFDQTIIIDSLLKSLTLTNIIYTTFQSFWYFFALLTVKTPLLLFRELKSLKYRPNHCYPDTLMSVAWCYLPLTFQACLEVFYIVWIALRTPKLLLEELFLKHPQTNRLQRTSPCGRKIVSWSDEIEVNQLRRISSVTGASETEILLAAIVDSLKGYFRYSGVPIPDAVLATAKFVSQRAILAQNHEARGILCLALPTRTPLFDDDIVEILQVIQKNIREARSKQSAIYAITAAECSSGIISSYLPSLFLKVMLNQLTRRYSLLLTHVDGNMSVEDVDTIMYWRPPQGNCNMSMTLYRHENGVRLGIMVDALIGPQHSIITRTFPKSIRKLASSVGVPRTVSRSPTPSIASPTMSPGY